MFKNKVMVMMASAMIAMPALVNAQATPTAGKGGTVSADQLVVRYTTLAGSEKNARSLVNGLRTGEDITLTGDPVTTKTLVREEVYPTGMTVSPTTIEGYLRELSRTELRPGGCTSTPIPRLGGAPLPMVSCDIYTVSKVTTVDQQEIFSPKPAAPMGFGNVDIALALTEAKLGSNAKPKAAELKSNLLEILEKRANGAGWGEIAKGYGFELK